MNETYGCGNHDSMPLEVQQWIVSGNEQMARHNREQLLKAGVFAVNLMGSPASGKTAVIEAAARALAGWRRIGVLSGDLATVRDAERLRAAGISAATVATVAGCHLDAQQVQRGLQMMPWSDLDILFIENAGNLLCPGQYDLGQAKNVVVLSVTEGEDEPLKYPAVFRNADLVLVSKVDLLPHLPELRIERLLDNLVRTMAEPRVILLSAQSGSGLSLWLEWLEQRHQARVVVDAAELMEAAEMMEYA
jgi:hydrogenase nickel incorporation protein HypB